MISLFVPEKGGPSPLPVQISGKKLTNRTSRKNGEIPRTSLVCSIYPGVYSFCLYDEHNLLFYLTRRSRDLSALNRLERLSKPLMSRLLQGML